MKSLLEKSSRVKLGPFGKMLLGPLDRSMVGKRQGEAQRATCMSYVVCYVMMQLKFTCPVRSCDAVLDGRPRPDLPCCVVAKALFDASPRMAVQHLT